VALKLSTMCEYCLPLYSSAKAHNSSVCPVKAAMYCNICQVNGHSTAKCSEKDAWHYRKPRYIEQLIPPSILSHYKIDSLTKIQRDVKEHPTYIHGDPVIEIPSDSDGKNIRAFLSSNNLPCSSVKENKRTLESFAKHVGTSVEYTEATATVKRRLGSKSKKPQTPV